ncbi:hypothetical protein ACFWAT_01760 [Streptomyces syringium]|uniref:hypothetical protein n=1 Tax=Streptomyces syringium TaxID=76729 RepID=UPI003657D1B1
MRRALTALATFAIAVAIPLGITTTAFAEDPITAQQCLDGGGNVDLSTPNHPVCKGGRYDGRPVY